MALEINDLIKVIPCSSSFLVHSLDLDVLLLQESTSSHVRQVHLALGTVGMSLAVVGQTELVELVATDGGDAPVPHLSTRHLAHQALLVIE